MRRARSVEVARHNDKIAAICLTGNFCAEHEWGIEHIANAFVLNRSEYGIERCRPHNVPEQFALHSTTGSQPENLLAFSGRLHPSNVPGNKRSRDKFYREFGRGDLNFLEAFRDQPAETTAAAWSGDDFAVRSCDPEMMEFLQDFFLAVQRGDAAIWLGAGMGLSRGGLCLGIASRLDPEFVQEMYDADVNWARLKEADKLTGIRDFLDRASEEQGSPRRSSFKRYGYYALRPNWAGSIKSTKDGEIKTDYDVIYFLNPMHQDDNNFGWFTVEDLMEWTEGRGPIPKTKEQKNG